MTVFSRVEHARTADGVIRQIEALILEGVLRDGDRLPGERELATQLQVSRPILRDALKTLEARGLMTTRQGGGTYVANVVGEVFAPPMRALIAQHDKATADYLEYRRAVEAVAAEMAALRATADDKALLTAIIARMTKAHEEGDFEIEAAIDVEFHSAVSECAHNLILMHTLRSCYQLLADGVFLNRSRIYGFADARDRMLEQHLAIYRAIIENNPQQARRAAEEHISFVEAASARAERTGEWERVSAMRLRQRAGSNQNTGTGKAGAARSRTAGKQKQD